jgi:hypothetical protein
MNATVGQNMTEFLLALEWFFYGYAAGILTSPIRKFLTKITQEAKLAKQEWGNPKSISTRNDPDEHAP